MNISTPKEKAIEIIHKMSRVSIEHSRDCAIIAVNEIIKEVKNKTYWEHVKSELVKIYD